MTELLTAIACVIGAAAIARNFSGDWPQIAYWVTFKRVATTWKPCASCLAFWLSLALLYFELPLIGVAGIALYFAHDGTRD